MLIASNSYRCVQMVPKDLHWVWSKRPHFNVIEVIECGAFLFVFLIEWSRGLESVMTDDRRWNLNAFYLSGTGIRVL